MRRTRAIWAWSSLPSRSAWKGRPNGGLKDAATRRARASAFQRHEIVSRILLLIFDGQVCKLITFLMRWKCAECGTTFRHYPEGIWPYKHYLVVSLIILCRRYIQEPSATYRKIANSGGPLKKQPLFYAGPVADKDSSERQKALDAPRALSHTTIWRWIATLAKKRELFQKRIERIQSTAGPADLRAWFIHPHKYRDEKRRQILVFAAQVLEVFACEKYPTDFETWYSGP